MSEAVVKAIEVVMDLTPDDRRRVLYQLQEYEAAMADVPQDIIDAELAEVEARMAAHEANPLPMATAEEAFARIFANIERRRTGQ